VSNRFAAFLDALPPDGPLVPCTPAQIAPYRERVSEGLVALWTEVGWGTFGNGLIHIVDPASIADGLELFLGSDNPARIAIARNAFGDIYYYRDMREEARMKGMTGENPGELGDLSYVDVHFKFVDILALDVEELFNETFADPDNIEGALRGSLARAAREIYGPLASDECFCFVPALALGGSEDIASIQKVQMHVHWAILSQM
jgi:hypothetical protein